MASNTGLGAILSQVIDGREREVQYISRDMLLFYFHFNKIVKILVVLGYYDFD